MPWLASSCMIPNARSSLVVMIPSGRSDGRRAAIVVATAAPSVTVEAVPVTTSRWAPRELQLMPHQPAAVHLRASRA